MQKKRILGRRILAELVAKKRVLVYLNGDHVYDVTDFCEDHPGGADLIEEYANKDISLIMADPQSHTHSESAYELLEEYFLGVLVDDGSADAPGAAEPKYDETETDAKTDFQQNKFIDLDKPLLMQVLRANWTKEFYLEQVHKPRHYGKGSAPIFGNFLEPLSKTPWYVIPIVHIPANMLFFASGARGLNFLVALLLYAFGLFLWTLVEYILHRMLFHLDEYLPNHQLAFTLHFLLHGVHHYLPMDRLRLVMPPALMVALTYPLYRLCHAVFREWHSAQVIFAGAYMGYIVYDCTHYFLHHKQLPQIMRKTKVHHLDHHYKNYQLGFGVTSKLWDVVFGTDFIIVD